MVIIIIIIVITPFRCFKLCYDDMMERRVVDCIPLSTDYRGLPIVIVVCSCQVLSRTA